MTRIRLQQIAAGVPARIAAALLLALFAASCVPASEEAGERESYATSLRVFGFILSAIVRETGEVEVLISDTQSPHAYHPRPSDMKRLSSSRVLFLGEPHLDGWAEELADVDVVYLSGMVDARLWPKEAVERNPHFWTDPILVRSMIPALTEELCRRRPSACDVFRGNAAAFEESLLQLESELRARLRPAAGSCVFAAQPFFDYFLDRFEIELAGTLEPIPGNEPSAAHVADVVTAAKRRNCIGILAQRRLPDTSARLLAAEANLRIIYLDPVGRHEDATYEGMMLRNASELLTLTRLP